MKTRVLDLFIAGALLVPALPVMAAVAAGVYVTMGSPIFFTQPRYGQNKKIFDIYKFRSMTNARDNEGMLLPPEQRMTHFGKFIRKYGFDELPQLLNILKGEMSMVGPRPRAVHAPTEQIPEEYVQIHDIKPGLLGSAQAFRLKEGRYPDPATRLKLDFNDAASPQTARGYLKILFNCLRLPHPEAEETPVIIDDRPKRCLHSLPEHHL